MKRLITATCIAALLLASVTLAHAQSGKPDFKINEVSKNEFGLNVTSQMLEPMLLEVPDSPDATFEFSSDITYGTQNGKPFFLPPSLNFTARPPRGRFPRAASVTIIMDGLPLKLRGVTDAISSGNISASSVGEGIVASETTDREEMLDVLIPAKTFIALANAKTVEIQVGSFTFPLRETHLKALREMLNRAKSKAE